MLSLCQHLARYSARLLCGLAVILSLACASGSSRMLALDVATCRYQTNSQFKLNGNGFTPTGAVVISLLFEPGGASPKRITKINANGAGGFEYVWDGPYYRSGPDTNTKQPSFVALDSLSGQSAVREVSSSQWYPFSGNPCRQR